jgi:hypothetical protein
MSLRDWWRKLRGQDEEQRDPAPIDTPEEKRISSVDIAGHSAAAEAERLAGRDQ